MRPETLTPEAEVLHTPKSAEIERLQVEEAKRAETIGAFRSGFKRAIRTAIEHDDVDAQEAHERLQAVEMATDGNTDIKLDSTDAGVLGYNTIGGGRSAMRLSRNTFANIQDGSESTEIRQTVAHEAAHGRQTQLHGTLEINGEQIDHMLLYEGHAEIEGNRAVGKSETEFRAGQPREVYNEGQKVVLDIISKTSRASLERALTGDGDLNRLQRELEPSYAVAG